MSSRNGLYTEHNITFCHDLNTTQPEKISQWYGWKQSSHTITMQATLEDLSILLSHNIQKQFFLESLSYPTTLVYYILGYQFSWHEEKYNFHGGYLILSKSTYKPI